jgi:4-hydroxy-2-oxoheptanedioate aldolase
LLRTAQEARDVVTAAKFPPLGRRGFVSYINDFLGKKHIVDTRHRFGSPFAMERFNPVPSFTEYLQQANDTLLTIVQIETKEALDAVDEIAAVDGIDALFVGPFDLGTYIGLTSSFASLHVAYFPP